MLQATAVHLGVFRKAATVNELGAAVFDDGGNCRAVNGLGTAGVDLRIAGLAADLNLLAAAVVDAGAGRSAGDLLNAAAKDHAVRGRTARADILHAAIIDGGVTGITAALHQLMAPVVDHGGDGRAVN